MSRSPSDHIPTVLVLGGIVLGAVVAFSFSQFGSEAESQAALAYSAVQSETAVAAGELRDAQLRLAAFQNQSVEIDLSGDEGDVVVKALGRPAHDLEIASWDIDVRPDGNGLPEGRGDALTGEEVFADNCASCHGDFGEAVDRWPVLAGGHDTLTSDDPVKTIGSYWPYLSTVFDYVNRAMPFGNAQSLSADDVYAITAYLLYVNDLVDEDFELSHENFNDIELPNTANFLPDNRAETEYAIFTGEPCMTDCKDVVEITARAAVVDVTPDETAAIVASDQTQDAPAVSELALAGEKVFRKCKSCHEVGEGAKNKSGPHLTDILGRTFAAADGFSYSGVFAEAAGEGRTWDEEALATFLTKPKAYMPGTKMGFAGLKKEADLAAIIAFLKASGE